MRKQNKTLGNVYQAPRFALFSSADSKFSNSLLNLSEFDLHEPINTFISHKEGDFIYFQPLSLSFSGCFSSPEGKTSSVGTFAEILWGMMKTNGVHSLWLKKWDSLTAISFIFTVSAVILSVTAKVYRDALLPVSALKLARQADIWVWKQMQTRILLYDVLYSIMPGLHLSIHQSIITTVGFIRVVSAVVLSITDEGREGTQTRSALEPSRLAFKLSCKQKKTKTNV